MSLSLYQPEEVFSPEVQDLTVDYEVYLVSSDDESVAAEVDRGAELIRHHSDWLLQGTAERDSHTYFALATTMEMGRTAIVGASKLLIERSESRDLVAAWLSGIAVAPAHRHLGLATGLIRASERLGSTLGAKEISAVIPSESGPCYRRLGYATVRQRGLGGALLASKTLA